MQRHTRKGLILSDTYYGVSVWSCVEVNIAIVSACLPTMRPLAQKMYPAALISWVFSSQKRKVQEANRAHHSEGLPDQTPEAAPGELHALNPEAELQGLVPEAAPRELQALPRYELAPTSHVEDIELGEVADPQSRAAVQKSLPIN